MGEVIVEKGLKYAFSAFMLKIQILVIFLSIKSKIALLPSLSKMWESVPPYPSFYALSGLNVV
jgi:hypothetical protein